MKTEDIDKDSTEIYKRPETYRNFMILFYPESIHYKFDDVIFNIHGCKYYAYIKHNPDEEEKQVHYHGYLRFDSATSISALSKRLGIPEHKIQPVKSIRSACRYLTHIDFPDREQYSLSDVKVSGLFHRKFCLQFEDVKTEEEIIQEIYNFLDNLESTSYHECLKDLIIFINFNCFDTVYKRYRPEFLDYLKMKF